MLIIGDFMQVLHILHYLKHHEMLVTTCYLSENGHALMIQKLDYCVVTKWVKVQLLTGEIQ